MARQKGPNTVRVTVTMPVELAEWIRAQAKDLSIDISSVVRILLLGVKKQQEEDQRSKHAE